MTEDDNTKPRTKSYKGRLKIIKLQEYGGREGAVAISLPDYDFSDVSSDSIVVRGGRLALQE